MRIQRYHFLWAAPLLAAMPVMAQQQATDVTTPASADNATAEGSASQILDLATAVRAALQSHPDVREASFRVQQREFEERVLRSEGRPVIEYSLQPGFDPESNRDAILQLGVSGRVPVYDFGRLHAERAAAALRTDRFRFLSANSEEEVAAEVVNQYLQFSLWRDAVAASDLQLEQLSMIRGRIEMRIAAGLADVSDLRRTDVSISRARLQRDQVISQMTLAADRIRMLSHSQGDLLASLESTERALMLTAHDAVQRADDMPTIAAARAEWEASRQDVRSARANRFPTISVGVTNNSYLLSERIAGQNSSDFANTTRYGVFLSGRIALGGGARQQINAAQAASQAAQSAYDSEVLRQDMALRSLQREQNDAEVRVSGTGRVITVLEQARDLYWQEYVLSKRRLTEVFDIEREIYQSRVDQLQARADRLGAIAEQLGIQGQLVETLLVEDQADVRP